MASTPHSVRFGRDVTRRLEGYVRAHPGSSFSSVVSMFVDEVLRMEEHPGITFRSGPTGRRAGLVGGPDVWEVLGTLKSVQADDPTMGGDSLVVATAQVLGIDSAKVRTAVRYYAAYPAPIDQRIAANNEEADRAAALWRAETELLEGRAA